MVDVIISTKDMKVRVGKTFDIDISVDPNQNPIAGLQLDINFDPQLMKINSITEGDLFKQSVQGSYFVSGTIDNNAGTCSPTYGVVLGPHIVNSVGIFATLNATAIGKTKSTNIHFSDLIVADNNGIAIQTNEIDGKLMFVPKYDLNMDGLIDLSDLSIISSNFLGTDPDYDMNNDGIINISDLILVAQHFGETTY